MDEFSLFRELLGFFERGQISALLVIVGAILGTTQLVKVTIQRLSRKPTISEIHGTSLASALLFGWFLWPSDLLVQKVMAIVLGWGAAASIATYGLRFLAEFFPRIHRVLQMDRRKNPTVPAPPGTGGLREGDNP
jgi:hypothetical protein